MLSSGKVKYQKQPLINLFLLVKKLEVQNPFLMSFNGEYRLLKVKYSKNPISNLKIN
jgi:hypothetical protein